MKPTCSLGNRCMRATVLLALATSLGCQQASDVITSQEIRAGGWEEVLSPSEVESIRETFPQFSPEMFAPGTPISGTVQLTPQNFSPASFFGTSRPQGTRLSSRGISIETNGFDAADIPAALPSAVTYIDRNHNSYQVPLGEVDLNPLHNLEYRMGGSLTLNPPRLLVDQRVPRATMAEIEQIMLGVQSAVTIRLPEVASVDPRVCEVVVEPTIFYVTNSNMGNTWAGGATNQLGGGRYRLHVELFYINSQRVFSDWRQYLTHEAINCFVLAVGRTDLAR